MYKLWVCDVHQSSISIYAVSLETIQSLWEVTALARFAVHAATQPPSPEVTIHPRYKTISSESTTCLNVPLPVCDSGMCDKMRALEERVNLPRNMLNPSSSDIFAALMEFLTSCLLAGVDEESYSTKDADTPSEVNTKHEQCCLGETFMAHLW